MPIFRFLPGCLAVIYRQLRYAKAYIQAHCPFYLERTDRWLAVGPRILQQKGHRLHSAVALFYWQKCLTRETHEILIGIAPYFSNSHTPAVIIRVSYGYIQLEDLLYVGNRVSGIEPQT